MCLGLWWLRPVCHVCLSSCRSWLGELTLTVFLVNLRNMLMSLHATTIFTKTSLWNQLGIGSLITDESYGVLLGEYVHHKDIPANWMHGNNIFSYLVWIVSSVVGCLIGSMIPNPELFGLDFALIAMFIGLLSSQIDALLGEGVRKLLLILLSIAVAYLSLVSSCRIFGCFSGYFGWM